MEKRGKILLLVVVIALFSFLTQLKAETVPTQLEAHYDNVPPVLVQNIPDQYLTINLNKTNAFNLDDYFIDNETLIYSVNYTGAHNVTAIIGSNNLVSFYPEYNFNGSINVTFSAYDGFVSTESNIVEIFVSEDTQPPQWSNPTITHAGTTIYQNVYVNFSVDWTDNFGLSNFVFMIDQGSGFASYSAETMTGTQNKSQYRAIITSSGGTINWKFGAYDLAGNYNETEVQNFTVATTPAPPESGGGETTTTQREPRYGAGYAPAAPTTGGKETKGFTISPESFSIELKQGSSITLTIKITNTGTKELEFLTSLAGLDSLSKTISETGFNISAGESKTVNIMLDSSNETPVDIHYGKITVLGGGEEKDIMISVTVRAAITDIDVNVAVLKSFKQVRPGKMVKANVTVENLAELDTKTVTLYYLLTDFVGNILDSKTEDFELAQKQISLEKNLTVPENVPSGEYIFFARATSNQDTNIASDTFFVGNRFAVWGFIKTNLLILLIIVASMIVALLMVKHYKNQERLRLLNLYVMITNLKKLLKENKLEDAINLYIRIKSSYGQQLSHRALQNKEELKQEMQKLTDKLHSTEAIKIQEEAKEQSKKEEEKPEVIEEQPKTEEKNEQPREEKPKKKEETPQGKNEEQPQEKSQTPKEKPNAKSKIEKKKQEIKKESAEKKTDIKQETATAEDKTQKEDEKNEKN
ncbi:MAG: hypothetical protein KKD18_00180 [Nanoarchaeota archaeon]|nr:hypothetical protein [Nanoarchaeota archaeon]MBU0976815.1 hypothetical protein [Nanoarchaeota archaeon]